jgi:hypothetical protein
MGDATFLQHLLIGWKLVPLSEKGTRVWLDPHWTCAAANAGR